METKDPLHLDKADALILLDFLKSFNPFHASTLSVPCSHCVVIYNNTKALGRVPTTQRALTQSQL